MAEGRDVVVARLSSGSACRRARRERLTPVGCSDPSNPFVHRVRGRKQRPLKRAGIHDFRWHDLRHTWASWHVQAGTPLHVLQDLGGWETAEMVRRYAHLSADHLAGYVDRVSGASTLEKQEEVATI